MIAAIRSLPSWLETALVIVGAFGVFIFSALAYAPTTVVYAADDFRYLAQFEIVIGTILLAFLFARGWKIEELGFQRPEARDVLDAVVLTIAILLVPYLLWSVFGDPAAERAIVVNAPGVPLGTALAFSLINAGYEEIFVCAYLVSATRKIGLAPAILLSTAVRLSYHLYQGPLALITILPMGLIFAWYFASRGKIWPLIFIHFILDMLALAPYIRGEGR